MVDAALDEAVTATAPLPVPDAGPTSAHGASLDAVQEQFGPFIVMPIDPTPPPDAIGLPRLDVSIVALQASASWLTVSDCPLIVSVPDRGKVVEFGSTE